MQSRTDSRRPVKKAALILCAAYGALAGTVRADSRFGACAHVTRDEFKDRLRTYEMMQRAGLENVRTDFDWSACQKASDAAFDFSSFDQVVDDAARYGITVLPILYGVPAWAQPVWEHEEEWRAYVRALVAHYGTRIPVVEIWNEENIEAFWRSPDPKRYVQVLKAAYEEVKKTNPAVRVAFGGTAGTALPFIRSCYDEGACSCFDIMCIHPYRHPESPDVALLDDISSVRKVMTENGDARKPMWITELGWPTHKAAVPDTPVLLASLKVARPEKKSWRVAYVDLRKPNGAASVFADSLREILPKGSAVAVCDAAALNRGLTSDAFDAVVMPFDESYPEDALDAIVSFVTGGGTLVAFGGWPFYFPYRDGKYCGSCEQGAPEGRAACRRLRIEVEAWWNGKGIPRAVKSFPSDAAKAVGLTVDPAGLSTTRFFTDGRLRDGDRLIPVLAAKCADGRELCGAGVYAFDSDMKGRLIVSSRGKRGGTSTERQQADYTVRAMDLSLQAGVEKYFVYEFRSFGRSPYDSESHFGLVHPDFTPKPAYEAVRRRLTGTASEAVDDLRRLEDLIRIPSVSADIPEVNRAVRYLRRELESDGLFCTVERDAKGREILFAATERTKTPDVLLSAHLDVMPAQTPELFAPRRENGRIYGRGASDCKEHCILAARLMRELKGKVSVGCLFGSDEETGGASTALMLARGYGARELVIVLDSEQYAITTWQKGLASYVITNAAPSTHSGMMKGPARNAGAELVKGYVALMEAMSDYEDGSWRDVVGLQRIKGSVEQGAMEVRVRCAQSGSWERIERLIREKTGCEPICVRKGDPVRLDESASYLQDFRARMRAKWPNRNVDFYHLNSSTDARHLQKLGKPMLILGVDARGAHTPDEHVILSSLDEYDELIRSYLMERYGQARLMTISN